MGFHTIFDGLDDIVSPGNLEVISLTERHDIKRCPFCDKSPIGVLYDSDEGKRVYRILCTQHQDECDPELRTAPSEKFEDVVWAWNARVSRVFKKYNIMQVFQEIHHEKFVSFLRGE